MTSLGEDKEVGCGLLSPFSLAKKEERAHQRTLIVTLVARLSATEKSGATVEQHGTRPGVANTKFLCFVLPY